jgi:hypothetical protein
MFNHLLQIASFKSGPQHFKTPLWAIIVFTLLFSLVQGYALSLTPGNELIRMLVASGLKIFVMGLLLYGWMRSVDCKENFLSVLMVILFVSLLAEVVKMPLTQMVRELKFTGEALVALMISIPILAIMLWTVWVFYYAIKEATQRSTGEIIVVVITLVTVSEVVGFVLSKIGSAIEGF